MNQRAYVFITTERGEADAVAAEIFHQDGVLSADQVFGRCDVIALIEANDLHGIISIVRNKIAQADHVVHTETLVVTSGM